MTCKLNACTEKSTRDETRPVIVVGTVLGIGLLCYLAFYKRGSKWTEMVSNDLAKAFNEPFHAHKYGFHHDADRLVYKRRNGNDVIRFGDLQFEFVLKLDNMPVWLHVNRHIGIVGINLFSAFGNQMS